MTNTTTNTRRPDPATGNERQGKDIEARPYRKPSIETFSGEEILQEIGPAQGYTGTIGGVDNPF